MLALCLCMFLSCSQQEELYTEILTEVFQPELQDSSYVQGKLKFSEGYIFDKQGKELQHRLYELDGSIKGVEKQIFEDNSALATGANYFDAQDNLLSYYKFYYNDQDQLTRKLAFEAGSDELLRIEHYHYDQAGNKIAKEIRSADDKIQSVYNYSFDEYGNEEGIIIRDNQNNIIYEEDFKIIAKDKDKKWVQKWGFKGEEAISFSIKRKRLLKMINEEVK